MLYGDVNRRSLRMHSDRTRAAYFPVSLHCHLVMATFAFPVKIRNDLRSRERLLAKHGV